MKTILSILFTCVALFAKANDSLTITLNKLSFPAKDTIIFECSIPAYSQRHLATATLNVWIESLEDKKVWKFRYPVINGKAEAALVISDSIPPGKYAVNFILQEGLFRLNGNLKNNYSYNRLNYLMLTRNKENFINAVDLSSNGDFALKNMVFQDEAWFIFSPGGKKKRNDLFISVVAPLDSIFTPVTIVTKMIDVKPELQTATTTINVNYRFDFNTTFANTTLPEVIVYAKGKSRLHQYDQQFSTGMFSNATRTFDGLDDRGIASAFSVAGFLQARIAGFRTDNSGNMFWRNQEVAVFIDEYRVNDLELQYINNDDIAMIKFYEAPAAITQGGGPAVAIYMKQGIEENNKTRRYRFLLKGYTAIESEWK